MARQTGSRSTSRSGPRASRRAPGLGVPKRAGLGKIVTSAPVDIEFASPEHRFVRADLEIDGIHHGEASYEGRIFLNNPNADDKTPRDLSHGYAGSFYIFGHGGCLGDPGHCEVNEHDRDPYDFRPPHPLAPAKKRITITEPVREAAKTAKTATITVAPIVTAATELCDTESVFRFEKMQFVTYN